MALAHDRSTDLVVAEIRRMAELCRGADLATRVPSCPDWDLAELLRHTGTVHRWAATMVERSSQQRLARDDMDWSQPDDPAALPAWLDEGADFVEKRFRAADPDTAMWAWGWPKTAGFWPRRMLHETSVHRADAELALGRSPTVPPDVAADGIDELLDNLPHAAYFRPNVAELKGDGETIALVATDLGEAWRIELHRDGFAWRQVGRAGDGADVTLRLSASDLLLVLYRRRGRGDVDGDAALLDRWLAHSAL